MRVAMTVFNTCHADARVLREAHALSAAGHEVRIFAIANRRFPAGIDYVEPGVDIRRVRLSSVLYVVMRWLSWWYHTLRLTALIRPRAHVVVPEPRLDPDVLRRMSRRRRLARSLRLVRSRAARRYRRVLRSAYLTAHRTLRLALLKVHRPSAIASYWWRATVLIERWRPDVIHAHDGNTLPLGARVARRTGATLVYDSHELWRHRNRSEVWRPMGRAFDAWSERRYVRRADAVITVSPSIAGWLRRRYGLDEVHLLRNTPDRLTLEGTRRERHRTNLRALAGLGQQDRIALYTGRVTTGRGIEAAIDVLPDLPPEVHLVLLGYGEELYVAGLLQRAADRGVSDRVRLVDPVPHELVAATAAQADLAIVAVQPTCLSYRFALPNKLFEAIQAGVPVVASRLPDVSALVAATGVGVTFAPGDLDGLRKGIEHVLGDREYFARAVRRAAHTLCWEVEQHRLHAVYDEIAVRRAGARSGLEPELASLSAAHAGAHV